MCHYIKPSELFKSDIKDSGLDEFTCIDIIGIDWSKSRAYDILLDMHNERNSDLVNAMTVARMFKKAAVELGFRYERKYIDGKYKNIYFK